jgi:hypothetical protein
MHRLIIQNICFLLIAGLLFSACTKHESAQKETDFTGVYVLVSVNGNPVPANITHESAVLQVRSGTFTINADGTCSTRTVIIPPSGTESAREVSATYTKEGPKLIMQWAGAGQTIGTIQGGTFTMDNEGMLLVYKK